MKTAKFNHRFLILRKIFPAAIAYKIAIIAL